MSCRGSNLGPYTCLMEPKAPRVKPLGCSNFSPKKPRFSYGYLIIKFLIKILSSPVQSLHVDPYNTLCRDKVTFWREIYLLVSMPNTVLIILWKYKQ